MVVRKRFMVAGHLLRVVLDDRIAKRLTNYVPFASDDDSNPVFTLIVDEGKEMPNGFVEEWRQEEEGQEIVCGQCEEKPSFLFRWLGKTGGWLVCSPDYAEAKLTLSGYEGKATLDNAMMVVFAMATSRRGTLLFHSSTVSLDGYGYMFLGTSGTGKSTHSRLWIENISGTELVNDDNPVVRVYDDGHIVVYGSPWSGKTPCYRQASCRLGGIVGLAQAPYNDIRRLCGIEAYALLSASVSGKTWDKSIADGLHRTLNALAKQTPVWHLDCLPNSDAATLCCNNIKIND